MIRTVIVALGNNRRAKSRGGNHHEHTRKQTGGHNGGFTKVDQTKDPCFFIEFPDARKGILAGGTPLTGPCPINPDAVPGTAATNLAPGHNPVAAVEESKPDTVLWTTSAQAATIWGLSPRQATRIAPRLGGQQLPDGRWLIPRDVVEAYGAARNKRKE